jgi:hypothetical protein
MMKHVGIVAAIVACALAAGCAYRETTSVATPPATTTQSTVYTQPAPTTTTVYSDTYRPAPTTTTVYTTR